MPVLDPIPAEGEQVLLDKSLPPGQCLRLLARYGIASTALLCPQDGPDLEPIPGTPYLWAELRQAARAEAVIHLDDLLLRRLRLGLLAPEGGLKLIDRIRLTVQGELGWNDTRWQAEVKDYTDLWRKAYRADRI